MRFFDLLLKLRAVEKQLLLDITCCSSAKKTPTPDKLLTIDSLATVRNMIDAFLNAEFGQLRTDLDLP